MIQVHLFYVYNLLIYNLEKQYENFCTAVIDLQETVYGSKAYFKTLKESNPKLVSILYKKLITVNTVCFSFLKQKSRIFLRKKSKISSLKKNPTNKDSLRYVFKQFYTISTYLFSIQLFIFKNGKIQMYNSLIWIHYFNSEKFLAFFNCLSYS